jgi:hypothetical protein
MGLIQGWHHLRIGSMLVADRYEWATLEDCKRGLLARNGGAYIVLLVTLWQISLA